jgi:hypothetical protein
MMVQNFQLNLNGGGSYINITHRAQGDFWVVESTRPSISTFICDGSDTRPNQLFRSESVAGTLTANSANSANKSIETTATNFSDVRASATSHSTSN